MSVEAPKVSAGGDTRGERVIFLGAGALDWRGGAGFWTAWIAPEGPKLNQREGNIQRLFCLCRIGGELKRRKLI